MLGAEPPVIAARESSAGEMALEVSRLSVPGSDQRDRLDDVSFGVRSGEIVGIAGISGNGQQALMAALAGEWRVEPDAVRLFGRPVGRLNPAQRRVLGLRYVPEQRLGHAAVAGMTLAENVSLTDASLHSSRVLNVAKANDAPRGSCSTFVCRPQRPRRRSKRSPAAICRSSLSGVRYCLRRGCYCSISPHGASMSGLPRRFATS